MKRNICLIRHAKTEGNLKRQYIGRTDEALCSEGMQELERTVLSRAYPDCSLIFSSPMKRCAETASTIYPNSRIVFEEDLRECDFGNFEGKTYSELCGNADYIRFLESNGLGDIPNGESALKYRQRCIKAFKKIIGMIKETDTESISIICHGGTIMAVMDEFDSPKLGFYNYQVKNCDGYICVFDDESEKFISAERIIKKNDGEDK